MCSQIHTHSNFWTLRAKQCDFSLYSLLSIETIVNRLFSSLSWWRVWQLVVKFLVSFVILCLACWLDVLLPINPSSYGYKTNHKECVSCYEPSFVSQAYLSTSLIRVKCLFVRFVVEMHSNIILYRYWRIFWHTHTFIHVYTCICNSVQKTGTISVKQLHFLTLSLCDASQASHFSLFEKC